MMISSNTMALPVAWGGEEVGKGEGEGGEGGGWREERKERGKEGFREGRTDRRSCGSGKRRQKGECRCCQLNHLLTRGC